VFSFHENPKVELLKSYKEIVKNKGQISLGRLLMKRKLVYIGLIGMFLSGFVVIAFNPVNPMPGTTISAVAAGGLVIDILFIAAIQRMLPFSYQFIDIKAVEEALVEYKKKKIKRKRPGVKLLLARLVFFALLVVVFSLMLSGLNK